MAYWAYNSNPYSGYAARSEYSGYDSALARAPDGGELHAVYSPLNGSYPAYASDAEYTGSSSRPGYVCMYPSCSVKPFNRSADLARHVQQVHPETPKKSYSCDYSRCPRKGSEPFYRKDHFRDHLRDYHKEDLGKRLIKSGSNKLDTLGLGGTNISPDWWRCSRCLVRNEVPYWDCSKKSCGAACERERREARLKLRETVD